MENQQVSTQDSTPNGTFLFYNKNENDNDIKTETLTLE